MSKYFKGKAANNAVVNFAHVDDVAGMSATNNVSNDYWIIDTSTSSHVCAKSKFDNFDHTTICN